MKGAKEYLKVNDIMPRISFKEKPLHVVKLLNSKQDTLPDGKGGVVSGLKVLVEEDGEKKTFFTSSAALITRLAEFEEDDVVTIELKSKKSEKGFISVYEITKGSGLSKRTEAEKIPVINLEEDDEIKAEDIPF